MNGSSDSSRPTGQRFLVDNDLNSAIARALREFGLAFESVAEVFGASDVPDPQIIEWLGQTGAIWVTHDRAARRRHEMALKHNRVTVLWVRGEALSSFDQLKIVVRVLDQVLEKTRAAQGALHFRATKTGGPTPVVEWAQFPRDMPRR